VCVLPFPVTTQCRLQIVVRVGRSIASGTVAHFEIKNIGVGPVHYFVPQAVFLVSVNLVSRQLNANN